jgi:crossover junction endodeoxyribonuclease RuvC
MIIGIDPGAKGAIAFFDPAIGSLVVKDMPTMEVVRNGKNKTEISPSLIAQLIREHGPCPLMAIIEKVGAMPGQGVSSMYAFGRGVGMIEGVLAGLNVPTITITPQVWRKVAKVRGGKDGSRLRACELFPRDAALFARVRDDGRAEAALIAWAGATA